MNIEDLPFNNYMGFTSSEDGVKLDVKKHHLNHLGTVHATVLYGLAEACSGKYIINLLKRGRSDTMAVTRSGNIKYKAPVSSNISAVVSDLSFEPNHVIERLESRGIARLTVSILISDDAGNAVANADYDWVLKAP